MGGSNSKEKAIKNIVKNNRNNLDEQKLEEIMMNTQFDEFEMLKLHEKFLSLDRNKRGKLTNREFLELGSNLLLMTFRWVQVYTL